MLLTPLNRSWSICCGGVFSSLYASWTTCGARSRDHRQGLAPTAFQPWLPPTVVRIAGPAGPAPSLACSAGRGSALRAKVARSIGPEGVHPSATHANPVIPGLAHPGTVAVGLRRASLEERRESTNLGSSAAARPLQPWAWPCSSRLSPATRRSGFPGHRRLWRKRCGSPAPVVGVQHRGAIGQPTHRSSGVPTVVAPTTTALSALAGSSTCPPLPGAMNASPRGSRDQRSRSLRDVLRGGVAPRVRVDNSTVQGGLREASEDGGAHLTRPISATTKVEPCARETPCPGACERFQSTGSHPSVPAVWVPCR